MKLYFFLPFCQFLGLFLISISSILSETLILNTGEEIEGKVVRQNVFFIEWEVEPGKVYQFPKERIRRIIFKPEDTTYYKPVRIIIKREKEENPVVIPSEPEKEKPVLIYEVVRDNRIYLIDVNGDGFIGSLKVSLVSQDSTIQKEQKFRNQEENSFLLCVDPFDLSTGEYDLLIEINGGQKEIRLGRYVRVLEKKETSQGPP